MKTRKTRRPIAAPSSPVATFRDGARVDCGGHLGTVVSTEFTPDDFGRPIHWQMCTVRWDDGTTSEMSPDNLEPVPANEDERAAMEADRARAFARMHD